MEKLKGVTYKVTTAEIDDLVSASFENHRGFDSADCFEICEYSDDHASVIVTDLKKLTQTSSIIVEFQEWVEDEDNYISSDKLIAGMKLMNLLPADADNIVIVL